MKPSARQYFFDIRNHLRVTTRVRNRVTMIKVPMPTFVITVNQVSAYAVALFRRAMLLLSVTVLVSK